MSNEIDFDRPIVSVWSSYGHRFMGTGECPDEDGRDSYESCLTCGAEYVLKNLGDGNGEYITNGGDQPNHCTYDTGMVHGIERVCQGGNGSGCDKSKESDDGTCEHTRHNCNCVQCD